MATLKLTVENSRFVNHNGVNVESFSPTYVEGNGWKCYIYNDGDISCVAEKHYKNVRHGIKLNIKKGWVKLSLKIGKESPKVLKSYKLESCTQDGVIGLPAGYIDKRKAYFRDADFQKFLDKYELTAVRYEAANGIYVLFEQIQDSGVIFKEEIENTDGQAELIFNDFEEGDEKSITTIKREVQVTNASWVIKKVTLSEGRTLRILYTSDNPKEIMNLPKK